MAKNHPNKEISAAIDFALANGWRFEKSNGHIFGMLYCPANKRSGCKKGVFSTPRNTTAHAKDIRKFVLRCDCE